MSPCPCPCLSKIRNLDVHAGFCPARELGVLARYEHEFEVPLKGAQLLATIEKEDAEQLAILRARDEKAELDLTEAVRYGQWQEAVKAREGLEKSFEGALARFTYYERLLGRDESEIDIPPLDELDTDALERLRLRAREPDLAHRPIEVDIDEELGAEEGRMLSSYEAEELEKLDPATARGRRPRTLLHQLAKAGVDPLTGRSSVHRALCILMTMHHIDVTSDAELLRRTYRHGCDRAARD